MPSQAAWKEIRDKHLHGLSQEEQLIVNALADGKKLPEIGRLLGQHRSMIWRKTKKIEKRLQRE